jgi:subtilisin family serine protease
VWGCASALIVGALVLAAGCASLEAAGPGAEPALPKQLVDRQVIVTLAPASPERWAALAGELAQAHALSQAGAFPLSSLGVQCIVFLVPADRTVDDVVARLAADPRVESVQPNRIFRGLAAREDPYSPLQHGPRAVRAWAAHRWATGRGVTVAVVDTGVETEHPDLKGRVARTANFVEGGERSFLLDRHGTAVTGVIAARAGDGVGISGIAPEAEIVAAKACWHRTPADREAVCSSWSLARAVDFAVTSGARVLNLSLTGPRDRLLERLILRALERKIVVVAAAVEDGAEAPGFPASLDMVIGVVSSDPRGGVTAAAHGGPPLLAAPGVDILTTVPRRAYDYLSGSSMAAAHVSGIVALLLQRDGRLTPGEVRAILLATARPAPAHAGLGTAVGLADACAAVARLVSGPPCPPLP